MSDLQRLYRIAVREKQPDGRKNASCWEYVCLATTLEGAKAMAVAEHTRAAPDGVEHIAAVGGHAMGLVYNSDIYGSKRKEDKPETLPDPQNVMAARALLDAYDRAHPEPEDETLSDKV